MPATPMILTAKLGEDFNWWVEQENDRPATSLQTALGVLDPRQLRHLLDELPRYRAHGFDPELFARAFQAYNLQAEVSEGLLRLERTAAELEGDAEMFALPRIDPDGDGPFYDLLDALGAAHVQHLNATHQFVRECTVEEMQEELQAIDQDRYFATENIHVFDQLNEILEWRPAEWDQE